MKSLILQQFEAWLETYGRASAENDAQRSANLFAPHARYYENPFDEPIVGRDAIFAYWDNGARTLADKISSFEILAAQNNCGIARWQSQFTVIATGKRCALNCVFLVEFDDDGLCQTFREWWHMREITNS